MSFYVLSGGVVTSAGAVFAVSGANGDIRPGRLDGFYASDTRFLSELTLRVAGRAPRALRAGEVGSGLTTFYTVIDLPGEGRPGADLTVVRDRGVGAGLREEITLLSHLDEPLEVEVTLAFAADFADLFEVRRLHFTKRGESRVEHDPDGTLVLAYARGDYQRRTRVRCAPQCRFEGALGRVTARLPPRGTWRLVCEVEAVGGARTSQAADEPSGLGPPDGAPASRRERAARRQPRRGREPPFAAPPRLQTVHPGLRGAWDRALADLEGLCLRPDGRHPIVAAGMPWFMAIFGRDSILTALETRILGPELLAGTALTLAAHQARASDPFREAEPGKIPHELRHGELAHFGEVPHACYYGTVDATPLFVILVGELWRWSGDEALVRGLLPAAEAALAWCTRDGDRDGDGFIEYPSASPTLRNQCWKDSGDAIAFADGRLAEGPIAVCEVQGYLYAARRALAAVYRDLGESERAAALERQAAELAERFDEAFWMAEEGYLALALDGAKRQVDAIASNAGHCLWSGIVRKERAAALAERLLSAELFSGWGVRTLSSAMARYHPLSYHNGSVWPHDTALIAAGLARYGLHAAASELIGALFEAAAAMPEHRLPELFAGHARRSAAFPVPYPGANAPQAWAAGAVVLAVETLLRLHPADDVLVSEMPRMSRAVALEGVPYRDRRWSF